MSSIRVNVTEVLWNKRGVKKIAIVCVVTILQHKVEDKMKEIWQRGLLRLLKASVENKKIRVSIHNKRVHSLPNLAQQCWKPLNCPLLPFESYSHAVLHLDGTILLWGIPEQTELLRLSPTDKLLDQWASSTEDSPSLSSVTRKCPEDFCW